MRRFNKAKQRYEANSEIIFRQMAYARCLITRGDTHRGLNILHNIVDNNTHPARVGAAWMLENYLSSGGTFEDTIDENNIDEAVKAYKRVVFFIDLNLFTLKTETAFMKRRLK